jgi:hypothetical protein
MTVSRKGVKVAAMILLAVLLLTQAFRIDKINPPVQSEISADPAVQPLLHRACYNCHSNETVWPWYSNLAPISWLLASDVKEGRSHVNFSTWGTYTSDIQSHKLAAIAEEVRDAGMPPWYYTLVHLEARLSPAERSSVGNWAEAKSRAGTIRQ